MKLFAIRGGIHPECRKELSCGQAIVPLPLPKRLYLPLQQHIGAPAEVSVRTGQTVRKGQVIAYSGGSISAPVHAPTSGRIVEITEYPAPHPSGLPQPTLVLEADGADEWIELPAPIETPFTTDPERIRQRVAEAGIVGMGGAAFPAAVKLNLGLRRPLDFLLINGAECEPYLTCDDRTMQERSREVIEGARLMAYALGAPRVCIGIERNKPTALVVMKQTAATFDNVTVVDVPVQYPMGSERHLVQALTGRETPAQKLTADIGVVVHNVATAYAVYQAVYLGRPLISRVVTVSGGAIRTPHNLEVLIGTPVAELVNYCGGFVIPPTSLVNGGPLMGQPLPSLEVPVVKGTAGILALTAEEINDRPQAPCIRCGTCVTICPCGLSPLDMAAFIRRDNLEGAANLGLMDCVSCGSCSWICPSHIPLVHYFNYAKGTLNYQAREKRKTERTKQLVEAHNERLARQAAAKRPAARKTQDAVETTV